MRLGPLLGRLLRRAWRALQWTTGMSNDDSWSVPAPPFRAEDALVQVKRALRELKLAERGLAYELKGKRVVELAPDATAIAIKLARRPVFTPEWDRLAIRSAVEQRKFIDEVKKRLALWERDE
jgi:hypothetical protein